MTLTIATIADDPPQRPQNIPVITVPYSGDFARDRNRLLQQIETEWVLMLDSDEDIEDWCALIDYTKTQKPQPTRLMIENLHEEYSTLHTAVRLLPNDPKIAYKGNIHEQPIFDGEPEFVNLRILHTGYREASPEKWERNYCATISWIQREPNNSMAWYHYGTLMMQKYRWHDALRAFNQVEPETQPFRAAAYNKIATCGIHLDDLALAKDHIEASLDVQAWQVKGWYLLYLVARMTETKDAAGTALLRMMQCEHYIREHGIHILEDITYPESWYQEQMEEVNG